MANTTLIKTYIFSASRETVWSFLTKKDKLAEWFHPSTADLVEGEDFALVREGEGGVIEKQCWGSVIKMDKPTTLIYSFTFGLLNGANTTVTWALEEIPGGTKLTLKHEGIAEAAGESALSVLLALDKGWDKHIDSLRDVNDSKSNKECAQ